MEPMGEKLGNTQQLFLMEFLIDKVNIPSVQAMQDDVLPVKTCIEFQILNLPPIFISQDAPTATCSCLGKTPQIFRKGKSCLFALPSRLLETPVCSFPICMFVYKKLPPTVLPDVMTIGSCQIETKDMLNCLLQEPLKTGENPCKTLKNNFRIATATGQCVGEVCVFLRVSRLGRKVVTQFQNPHNKKPYLFKGTDNSPVFQCRKVPSHPGPEDDPTQNCVCKPEKECKADEPEKNCCQISLPKKPKKSKRPCCPVPGKKEASGKCQSKKPAPCESEQEDVGEKPTRQCGCEIKDNKQFACGT